MPASLLADLHEEYARSLAGRTAPAAAHRPGAATGRPAAPPELDWLPWGPADERGEIGCEIVATYGEVEAEYAALRKAGRAGLFDGPHRGTLLITGADRLEFLNRMVTAELRDMSAGAARRTFWLNRTGRIDADMVLAERGDRIVASLDIHQAAHAAQTLGEFIFAEDVTIQDDSRARHHLMVHGEAAMDAIAAACGDRGFRLDPDCCAETLIGGAEVMVVRQDCIGAPGFELIMHRDHAAAVWRAFMGAKDRPGMCRPIGWYAFNTARIEAGTPLFNIDFGPTNLPHETGVLHDRVSFTKGCYLGQEVVARMESRGKPKQAMVGLRVQADLLPVAGGQVFERTESGDMGEQIGVVTSSTISPMLGAAPIAFAMMRQRHAVDGAVALVNAEGAQAQAIVQRDLRFVGPQRDKPV
jgi:folate-binding protein YgfZ